MIQSRYSLQTSAILSPKEGPPCYVGVFTQQGFESSLAIVFMRENYNSAVIYHTMFIAQHLVQEDPVSSYEAVYII